MPVWRSPLAFSTSSIGHYCIWDNSLIFDNSLAEFIQNQCYYYERKGSKERFLNKIVNPSLVSKFLNLERLVPLPTMEGKLQAFPLPCYDGIQLEEMVCFPDSGKCLRRCRLLHNTLTSQSNNYSSPPRDAICHVEPTVHTHKTIYCG